jgi:hypothetical protein
MRAIDEFELQWKVSCKAKSKHTVKIIDVYKANIEGHKAYLVVME